MNIRAIVLNLLQRNNNPMLQNLVNMAQQGNTKGVEEFARNYMKEQGRDFDTEFANFKNQLGSK